MKNLYILLCALVLCGGFFVPKLSYADFTAVESLEAGEGYTYLGGVFDQYYGVIQAIMPKQDIKLCSVTVSLQGNTTNATTSLVAELGFGTSSLNYGAANHTYSPDVSYRSTNVALITDTSPASTTFYFNGCKSLVANTWYNITVHPLGGVQSNNGYQYIFRNSSNLGTKWKIHGNLETACGYLYRTGYNATTWGTVSAIGCKTGDSGSSGGAGVSMTFNEVIPFGTSTAATSTSSYDVSASQAYCDQQFPSSGYLDFSNNLCLVLGYVFIPSKQSVDDLRSIPDLLTTKVPFAYISEIWNDFGNLQPVSSTSQNFQGVAIDFPSMHVATNTLVVLPSVVFFSTSTLRYYLSDSTWALLKSLMGVAIYMSLALNIFFTVRNLP